MYRYRVFLSFSTTDQPLRDRIADRLSGLGAAVYDIPPGSQFPAEIREQISNAHLFVPLLTANSIENRWVNQEIGFAQALEVPTSPLATTAPDGFLETSQALRISADGGDLRERLTEGLIERVIESAGSVERYEGARLLEDRTRMLVDNLRRLEASSKFGRVRQLAAFASFSLPTQATLRGPWKRREGENPNTKDLRNSETSSHPNRVC